MKAMKCLHCTRHTVVWVQGAQIFLCLKKECGCTIKVPDVLYPYFNQGGDIDQQLLEYYYYSYSPPKPTEEPSGLYKLLFRPIYLSNILEDLFLFAVTRKAWIAEFLIVIILFICAIKHFRLG